jgi:hypothetical protein
MTSYYKLRLFAPPISIGYFRLTVAVISPLHSHGKAHTPSQRAIERN